ncbi:MAG: 16S rRNA (guanine(966)-N(2))-methyltransferase RsmD [Caulobacteraceae bacterium]
MRIVGGTHRGRPIVAPKGHSARPTADRVRQAMFDVLEHAPWSSGVAGRRVVDLFAGSGALGLEALSRGAAFCLFVDHDRAAREAIAANLANLGLEDRGRVLAADATRGASSDVVDDLVFLDPPYGGDLAERTLRLLSTNALARGALLVIERQAAAPEIAPTIEWHAIDTRFWGAARVDFLTRRDAPVSERRRPPDV